MSSYSSYYIDKATRFLIHETDNTETVITDLKGSHELTKIYCDLAVKMWTPDTWKIGVDDLLEKEKLKGFVSWKTFLKKAFENLTVIDLRKAAEIDRRKSHCFKVEMRIQEMKELIERLSVDLEANKLELKDLEDSIS